MTHSPISTPTSAEEAFSFVKMEKEILAYWKQEKIFEKSLEQTKECPPYIFYDGPPFATGLPHHGHLVSSTLKDIIPRYFTMKNRFVLRRFGWDCHGVPIEHEADKMLGKSTTQAVAELGIAGYNQQCRSLVSRFTKEWQKTIERLGRWVDFENCYRTMDFPFMESVWWGFKQLWEKNLIYKGKKVVPFSSGLGTVLSNFEASSNYQEVQDPAITVCFSVADSRYPMPNTYFLAWTTTPWTLPSNLGLCVNPDLEYSFVQESLSKKIFIVAKECLETTFKEKSYSLLETKKGSELEGICYTPLFPFFKDLEKEGAFKVFCDSYVDLSTGTGIVHLAPGHGEEDARVFEKYYQSKAPIVSPVLDDGTFSSEITPWANQYVKQADKDIIKTLKERGQLFAQSVIVHKYPFCPRTDTPLLYKAIPSWYVKVTEIKNRLPDLNQSIHWVPAHIKEGRFGKWLENAKDWAISRNRIWGTPLPIWYNEEADKYLCVGSAQELQQLTKGKILTDLHREFVDPLSFSIEGEIGTYKRVPEVLDCWFESGSMPFASIHYPFENKNYFEKGFPAEFIAEGQDQTRGWFYTLHVLSTALFDKNAFNNVIVNGIVKAHDGKKMSKRLKNYTPPDDLMEHHGADSLRLYLINSGLVKAEDQNFTDEGVKEMTRKAILPWFNAFKFFSTYAKIDNFKTNTRREDLYAFRNPTDQWILSQLQSLKLSLEIEMERYHLFMVVPKLLDFIENLTNWYIRLNRARFWSDDTLSTPKQLQDKQEAYETLFMCLYDLSLIMAPFTPFLSEYIFRELRPFLPNLKNHVDSVHLQKYPVCEKNLMRPHLEVAVDRIQQTILMVRQKRNQEKIKVKIPLPELTILHRNKEILENISLFEGYLKSELNIKKISYSTHELEYVSLEARPNAKILGKKFGKNFPLIQNLFSQLDINVICDLESGKTIQLEKELFSPEDVLIFRSPKNDTVLSNRFISLILDCTISEELENEGLAREFVSMIQKLRKNCLLEVQERIVLEIFPSDFSSFLITQFKNYIEKETLSSIVFTPYKEGHLKSPFSLTLEGKEISGNLYQK